MSKFVRVPEDSPDRCQGIIKGAQCPYKKMENEQYCPMHGPTASHAQNKRKLHEYRLNQVRYKQRHDEFTSSSDIKNLAGEIGLVRLLIEELVNKIDPENTNQVLLYSDKISGLINQTHKLTLAFQSLQEKNRDLLSRATVFTIADAIVNILSDHIDDPDTLLLISEKLNDTISRIISGEDNGGSESQVDH